MKPYKQINLTESLLLREFSSSIESHKLVWHRDKNDRVIKILEGVGWQLQMDGKLPKPLIPGQKYYIPANTYHRVVKGSSNLKIVISETKGAKMRLTRRQLRKIISEVKREVGEITFSGKYFDIQYGARGIGVAKDIYVIVHRASGKVIPTSMYKTSPREVKSLVKLIEKSIGPALGNPELETDFDTLHKIYGILKDWPHKQVGR